MIHLSCILSSALSNTAEEGNGSHCRAQDADIRELHFQGVATSGGNPETLKLIQRRVNLAAWIGILQLVDDGMFFIVCSGATHLQKLEQNLLDFIPYTLDTTLLQLFLPLLWHAGH